jgi:hypothetical protein
MKTIRVTLLFYKMPHAGFDILFPIKIKLQSAGGYRWWQKKYKKKSWCTCTFGEKHRDVFTFFFIILCYFCCTYIYIKLWDCVETLYHHLQENNFFIYLFFYILTIRCQFLIKFKSKWVFTSFLSKLWGWEINFIYIIFWVNAGMTIHFKTFL